MPSQASSYKTKLARSKGHLVLRCLLALWLIFVVWAVFNRQGIVDWWKLLGYKPPAKIASLERADTMTPYAKQLFGINHPALEDEATFNSHCPNDGGEKTIVLGCYHSDQDGIFLLSVNDPRLTGVEQVTAAHEMLHAAYDRLSGNERNYVDGLLESYYKTQLKNPRIVATIDSYRQTEPHQVVNEMHSIFGTEVAHLPAALENYYKRYFTNRQVIAGYAASYQAAFTSRQDQVTADDSQLASDKNQIGSLEASLNTQASTIKSDSNQLLAEKTSNVSAYNAGVPSYNAEVDSYNSDAVELKDLLSSYNALVTQRNSVALVENQLYSELSGAQAQPISNH